MATSGQGRFWLLAAVISVGFHWVLVKAPPAPVSAPTPVPTALCEPCNHAAVMVYVADPYPSENSWTLSADLPLCQEEAFPDVTGFGSIEETPGTGTYTFTLSDSLCTNQGYTFVFRDSFGDGLTSGFAGS
eukprot:CAMPEP_0118986434 /NCGR_PEP_ID=MMETSP1173-20130426/42104_1 /TAXON_ID=1034831 /ORGANISM="Rhizochromulina marina cf, Strain CCMP1243" /LENGTH=130 /DNA_ID=CAMNT_0006937219 /DNA_START=62 /DNA_END=451 /DNA_ORIENTATION=+